MPINYEKQTYVNGSGATPLSAERLNHNENGTKAAADAVDAVAAELEGRLSEDQLSATFVGVEALADYTLNGIYENFAPANFRKFRAALAAALAGVRPARVCVVGDSNSTGFQQPSGTDYLRSYGARAQVLTDDEWGPARTGLVYTRVGGASSFVKADQRTTLGSGWSQLTDVAYGVAGMGAVQGVGPTAGLFSFIATEDVNAFDVYFKQASDAPTAVVVSVAGESSGGVYVEDTFTRTDAASPGSPETGPGGAYLVSAAGTGTWSTNGTQLVATRPSGSVDGSPLLIAIDAGESDVAYEFVHGSSLWERMLFRYVDPSNYLMIAHNGSGHYIMYRRQAGANTVIASSTRAFVAGDVMRVECIGSSLKLYVNGVQVLSAIDAFQQTATKFGYGVGGAGAQTVAFDRLLIADPSGASVSLAGSSGVKKVTVLATTTAKHRVDVDVESTGTAVVLAVEAYDTTRPGVRWTLVGKNGGRASDYNAAVSANPWGGSNLLHGIAPPDLYVINLMINHHNSAQAVSAYKAELLTFVQACKAVGDVILVASAAGGNGASDTWDDYLDAQREIAREVGCGLINMQERWGAYAVANSAPYLLWNDADHPSNAGYWDMGDALRGGVRLAAGRSA